MSSPSTVTADELNLLVMRYLQESGFTHSAYVFAHESLLGASLSATADLPPGALVGFVHRGVLFTQMEREVRESLGMQAPSSARGGDAQASQAAKRFRALVASAASRGICKNASSDSTLGIRRNPFA